MINSGESQISKSGWSDQLSGEQIEHCFVMNEHENFTSEDARVLSHQFWQREHHSPCFLGVWSGTEPSGQNLFPSTSDPGTD